MHPNSCAPARRYRTIEIRVGAHTLTTADLLPGDVNDALYRVRQHSRRTNSAQLRLQLMISKYSEVL